MADVLVHLAERRPLRCRWRRIWIAWSITLQARSGTIALTIRPRRVSLLPSVHRLGLEHHQPHRLDLATRLGDDLHVAAESAIFCERFAVRPRCTIMSSAFSALSMVRMQ